MRHAKLLARLVVMLVFLAGCAPCDHCSPASSPGLGRIRAMGELVVGTAASMPPLNMTTKTGEIIGLEVDLARAMAAAMKVKLRLATIPFADLLSALEAGQVDMVLSGMTMTPERNMSIRARRALLRLGQVLPGQGRRRWPPRRAPRISTTPACGWLPSLLTSQTFVEQNMPKATLVLTKDYDEDVKLVLEDKVDAMIADFPICILSVQEDNSPTVDSTRC